jgi:large subunit ribosomal protein L9
MEIILTQDVPVLGMAGQVLKVAPGYARNYLLPGSYALPATPLNLKRLAKKREEFEQRSREAKENALVMKQSLESVTLTVTRKSVDKGKLYGAVTPQDIVDAAALENIVLDRRRLKITEPIKAIGDYEITVRLHPEVTGSFKLKVAAEAVEEEEEPEADDRQYRSRKGRSRDYGPETLAGASDDAPEAAAAPEAAEAAPEAPEAPEAPGPESGTPAE